MNLDIFHLNQVLVGFGLEVALLMKLLNSWNALFHRLDLGRPKFLLDQLQLRSFFFPSSFSDPLGSLRKTCFRPVFLIWVDVSNFLTL